MSPRVGPLQEPPNDASVAGGCLGPEAIPEECCSSLMHLLLPFLAGWKQCDEEELFSSITAARATCLTQVFQFKKTKNLHKVLLFAFTPPAGLKPSSPVPLYVPGAAIDLY